jgi:cytoskeletal protein CcmA (bactofilin family)
MATSNTKFKVENGLDVVGTANVSGTLRVDGDLSVGGNLAVALTVAGDIKPTANHSFNLGNTTFRWSLLGSSGDFSNTLSVSGGTTLNTATAKSILPSANNEPLGSSTRRWALQANTIEAVSANVSTTLNVVGNTTVNGALTINNTVSSGNTTITGSANISTSLSVTGNVAVSGNAVFDTDLLFLDAFNNRVGIKTTLPSTVDLLTIAGNTVISGLNTALRFLSSNATHNGSVMISGSATNTRLTVTTYEANATASDGGFLFNAVNATTTTAVLAFNQLSFQYKTGNVAHAGNFGIFDSSGTRLGP